MSLAISCRAEVVVHVARLSGAAQKSMETIGKTELWSFVHGSSDAVRTSCSDIRVGSGHTVESYLELATKVAELQFRNRDHVLLFRGQDIDHRNRARRTTLKPSLLRPKKKSENPSQNVLRERFQELDRAELNLVSRYELAGLLGIGRLRRHKILRWSILQHYNVCSTPLLDVTHSLRIAASFASLDAGNAAFVFVLGVPNLSGAITASAEAGLQIVRLSSVCPPSALRPHIQEGYLLGEYPEMADFEQKEHYFHYEIDFGRRLVAKFRFDPRSFWKRGIFPKVSREALYPPPKDDQLYKLALEVKNEI